MKNNKLVFLVAAVLSISAAARAAEVDFDSAKSLDSFISEVKTERPQPGGPGGHQQPGNNGGPGGHQQPGQPQPGNHGQPGNDNNHGQPGNDNNHGGFPGNNDYHGQPGNHGGFPPPYNPGHNDGWDNPNPPTPSYNFAGYRESCNTIQFNAQSPLTVTQDMIMEEVGTECQSNNYGGNQYCTPSTKYHKRKVVVNIGARKLEAWETERLQVCMKSPDYVTADVSGMLYEYSVASQNHDTFFGGHKTSFMLTPGAKKPAQADGKELSMTFAGITTAGDVRMTLADNRADYFRGEKITITADGMNIPNFTPDMTPDQIINAFVKFNVTVAFDVNGTYELKLMDAPKPGKYMVTIKFFRSGPLSSGAVASTIESFEVK